MANALTLDLDHPDLLVGVVQAAQLHNGVAPAALHAELDASLARLAGLPEHPPATTKKALRDLLRTQGYKPTGRGKPASEYLAEAARSGAFPRIDTLVDVNNLVSLESGLPISILDAGLFTAPARLRFGRAGESYIFNRAGHTIDLQGLLVVCDGENPCGTPVKDSMATKVSAATTAVLGVLYGHRAAFDRAAMARWSQRLADLLSLHAAAQQVAVQVLP